MADLNETMKKLALQAIEESSPTAILFGEVTGTDPLEITIDQKLKLTEEFLILTSSVRDHKVYMTVNHSTNETYLDANHDHAASSSFDGEGKTEITNKVDPTSTKVTSTAKTTVTGDVDTSINSVSIPLSHSHGYSGKKEFLIHNGLIQKEKVILLRVQGGQKYLVLDRVVG